MMFEQIMDEISIRDALGRVNDQTASDLALIVLLAYTILQEYDITLTFPI